MLSPLKCSLPKANGYYHPLAISFPGYWIPWSNIGIRSPEANGHKLYCHPSGHCPPLISGHRPPWIFSDIMLPDQFSGHYPPQTNCRTLSSPKIFRTLSSQKNFQILSPLNFFFFGFFFFEKFYQFLLMIIICKQKPRF